MSYEEFNNKSNEVNSLLKFFSKMNFRVDYSKSTLDSEHQNEIEGRTKHQSNAN